MYINGVARALAGMLNRPVVMEDPMYRWPGISLSDYSERGIQQRLLLSQYRDASGNLAFRRYLGQRVIGGVCYHSYGPKGLECFEELRRTDPALFNDDISRMYDHEVQPLCIGTNAAEHHARQFAHLASSPLPLLIQRTTRIDDSYRREMQDWERKVKSVAIPRELLGKLTTNIGTV